jgi:hypothetical protein
MKRVLSKSIATSAAMITGMTAMTIMGAAASTVSASATTVSAVTAQANPQGLAPYSRCLPGNCPT